VQLAPHRPPERIAHVWARLSATFWALCLAVIALFAFFWALGAFNAGDAIGVTIAVVALTGLWIGHAIWVSRHHDGQDSEVVRARERRGF
jgi:uncharacterized membrane protein YhaH (DUF805 family)